MTDWLQYAAAATIVKILGALPRPVARAIASTVARVCFACLPKLRKAAEFNLHLAFPDWDKNKRRDVIRKMVRNLGWMAAEFARLPKYTRDNI